MLFILAIIVFYSGEMVWRERSVKINLIYDALPVPNWLSLSSKMLALTAIIFLLMSILIVCGIITQLVQGFFDIELGLYIETLLGYRMINLLLFAAMSFFIQVMANNKYLGFRPTNKVKFLIRSLCSFMQSNSLKLLKSSSSMHGIRSSLIFQSIGYSLLKH